MVRAILYLLGSILLITVLRAVIGVILKGFGELFQPSAGSPSTSSASDPAQPQSLKKDPVCGTFVVSSTPHRKAIGATQFYFCSPECRDKFQG
ncbi:MAG: hypothetical protein ABI823_07125 [Bryobacteraceae bacterium]